MKEELSSETVADAKTLVEGSEYTTIRIPANIHWNPKEDITTYELARALIILLHMVSGGDTWTAESLLKDSSEDVKRHFEINT